MLQPLTISGTITLELRPIPGQDRLAVTGEIDGYGQVNDLVPDTYPVAGEVRATLNCATHQLEHGHLISTTGATRMIVGTVGGAYSDSPPSLNGTWMTNDLLFASNGTWSGEAVSD